MGFSSMHFNQPSWTTECSLHNLPENGNISGRFGSQLIGNPLQNKHD